MKINLLELLEDSEQVCRKQHTMELAIIFSLIAFGQWVKNKRAEAVSSGMYSRFIHNDEDRLHLENEYKNTPQWPDYLLGKVLPYGGKT